MKGNKMSAILAILLMLSGALFVPRAFAQVPAESVTANPTSLSYTYPAKGPGDTFTAYVDVTGVTDLFSFQVGFRFDAAALQVTSIAEGGFLSNNGLDLVLSFPGVIDNVGGKVTAYGWSLTDTTKAKSTPNGVPRHLITIGFQVNPALWPPYTDGYPGGPTAMIDLTDVDMDPCELILMYKDGASEITPAPQNIFDGFFTLSVAPANPIAAFVWLPVLDYAGEVIHFDASGSTQGWNGWAWVAIVDYAWDWAEVPPIPIEHVGAPLVDHTYANAGTYHVTLVVTDADGRTSAPTSHDILVITRPSGPVLDLQNQRWRYVDPIIWDTAFFGEGPNTVGDTFRPGDWVQMLAYASYNGDPVQHQLIAFEVRDNQGNIVLTGTALTNASGWALYEFRIPWPCTGPEPYFGIWTEIAKWSIGMLDGVPFMKTINDTKTFMLSWGVTILDIQTTDEFGVNKAEFFKSEIVYVKMHVRNDYLEAVLATLTVDLYDDLMVPINGPAILQDYVLAPGTTTILNFGIHIEKWAYVGVGTVKANAFTRLPFLCGTSYCPEVTATFVIKKTP